MVQTGRRRGERERKKGGSIISTIVFLKLSRVLFVKKKRKKIEKL